LHPLARFGLRGTQGRSLFQKNLIEIIDLTGNTEEFLELSEAAADMFLNWVYRSNDVNGTSALTGIQTSPIGVPNPPQSGCILLENQTATPPISSWIGFLNQNWGAQGAPYDWGLPGDVRHSYMNERIPVIFAQNDW
jgi:hypothetical protein